MPEFIQSSFKCVSSTSRNDPPVRHILATYPTSKVSTAIPLTLCSAHLTLVLLEKLVLISRAVVLSPIEKVYIPSVR